MSTTPTAEHPSAEHPGFEISETGDPAIGAALLQGLFSHNRTFVGADDTRPLAVLVRDPATGAVRGGLNGRTRYRWLYVDNFFLPDELRGGGLGARLLAAAEAEARTRGCIGAYLDTNSFQAPAFYEKQGYVRFGTLADYPAPGQAKFYYAKRFETP
jgi:GNAT superfamily N-acetyltransferase